MKPESVATAAGELADVTERLNIPWVDSPFFEALLEKSRIDEETKSMVRRYANDGYLVFDPGIEDFDLLAERILNDVADSYGERRRVPDGWCFSESVKALATAPRILSVLESLYRREPVPFQTLNFRCGSEQRTHSDAVHFYSVPARFMCGVWVALENVDEENGPLHYYPGSHKLPLFTPHDLGVDVGKQESRKQHYEDYEDFVERLVEATGLQKVEVKLKKGEVLIWSAHLLHGGSPIRDPQRTRHSQVTHVFFAGCRYYIPVSSDPFLGIIDWKEPVNITTGELQPQYHSGRLMKVRKRRAPGKPLGKRLADKLRTYPSLRRIVRGLRGILPRKSV
jgi:hypothetical protein